MRILLTHGTPTEGDVELKIEHVRVEDLHPDDVIVTRCDGRVSVEVLQHIRDALQPYFPDNKVVVLADGMELEIVAKTEAPET